MDEWGIIGGFGALVIGFYCSKKGWSLKKMLILGILPWAIIFNATRIIFERCF